MKKLDLLMWTLNGESTLPSCLKSIEEAVPSGVVGQKIVVDAHSVDDSKAICEKFGWTVVDAERVGIPFQANQALRMVESELYASFEQDIVLNPLWFRYVMPHLNDRDVAVAQGVRVCVNPVLRELELYALGSQVRYTSLDNTIYRTDVMRELGGYNGRYLLSVDRDLEDRVVDAGYKWRVDRSVVSDHLKDSIRYYANKVYGDLKVDKYTQDKMHFLRFLAIFAKSPLKGFEVAVKRRCPEIFFVYPYLRLMWILGFYKR